MIMAGGFGERMLPLTTHIPKPLLPLCNKAPIVQAIEQIHTSAGVNRFYVKIHHLAGMVQSSLGYGNQFGEDVRINYLVENPQLYTAGGVRRMFHDFKLPADRPFWVLSGDIFSPETDLGEMAEAHARACKSNPKILGTISLKLLPVDDVVGRFGVAVVNKDGLITEFTEKPKDSMDAGGNLISGREKALKILERIENEEIRRLNDEAKTPLLPVNASHYLFQGGLFDQVEQTRDDTQWDFGSHVFPLILGRLNSYLLKAPWSDVGYPEDYWRAQWYFMRVANSSLAGQFIKNWGHIGQGGNRDEHTNQNMRNVVIGNNVRLENCNLDHAVIGEGCHLKNVTVKGSVLLPYTYVNLRGQQPVGLIENSVVGGRLFGGTFIDRLSMPPTADGISRQLAVPDRNGQITIQSLNVDDKDISDAMRVA